MEKQTMNIIASQLKAEILRTIRNRRFVIFTIIMPAIFYFIFTNTIGGNTQVGGVEWKAYYLMSMTAYGVIGASVTSLAVRFSRERSQGWTRLLQITPLPSSIQIGAKIFGQGLLNLCIILFMFVLGAVAQGVSMPAMHWIESGLWIWIGSFAFMSLGALLGTIRNVDVVQVVANLIFMGLSIAGGLWMPISTMPNFMQTIAKALPTYQLGQGAWNIIGAAGLNWSNVAVLAVYVLIFMLLSTYIVRKREVV